MTWFLPTWSRRWEEPVLHTYVSENQWWKTGNSGAVWTTLGSGDWLLRWSSSDKNRMNRLLTSPYCSSVLQFLRAVMNWTRTTRNPWRLGFGACGTKFDEYGPLFIGLLGPIHRGDGVLHFLSMNRTLIRLRFGRFLEEDELQVGYDMETKFPTGLRWVKENTLSGIGSPGLVRLAPGYDSRKSGYGFFLIRESSGLLS
jgi:hypothetical protein